MCRACGSARRNQGRPPSRQSCVGAATRKEFARFLGISINSSTELEYQLELARDFGVLPQRPWRSLQNEAVEVRMMTCGYRASILRADAKERRKKGRGKAH